MITIHDIFKFIPLKYILSYSRYDLDKEIISFASLDKATSNDLSFCKFTGDKALEMINSSNAGLIICCGPFVSDKNLIVVDNPRLWFIKIVREFFMPREPPGIHPSAVINEEFVEIGENVRIGPNCTIGFDGFGFEQDEDGVYYRFPILER